MDEAQRDRDEVRRIYHLEQSVRAGALREEALQQKLENAERYSQFCLQQRADAVGFHFISHYNYGRWCSQSPDKCDHVDHLGTNFAWIDGWR